ncbi:MAG: aminoglycoside phosphotransferase family protein [Myxococcota bacterium]
MERETGFQPVPNIPQEALLHELARIAGECSEGRAITGIRVEPFRFAASYAAHVASVTFGNGTELRLFVKDFSTSRLVKDARAARRQRERRVYADLLGRLGLGTARYHGCSWDEVHGRYWLFLELVEGELLRRQAFPRWHETAAWLGRMQSTLAREPHIPHDVLPPLDRHHFEGVAERALMVVRDAAPALSDRLERALQNRSRTLDLMTAGPLCMVHGSFRPDNILVATSSSPPRICPVDWELAALGNPLFDLAYLCDGFTGWRLDQLVDAFQRHVGSHVTLPPPPPLHETLRAFQVHKMLSSLGKEKNRHRTAEVMATVVQRIELLSAGNAA